MPSTELRSDFVENRANINLLKELADKKYSVSLFVLINRLVEFAENKYAVIQSENRKVIKTFQGERPLISNEVDQKTKASSFFSNPSKNEEIREGLVPASYWVIDLGKTSKFMSNQFIIRLLGKYQPY